MKLNKKWAAAAAITVLTSSALFAYGNPAAYAKEETKSNKPAKTQTNKKNDSVNLQDGESVYVLTNAKGSVRKVMGEESAIEDIQTTKEGDSEILITNIDGKELKYKGNVEKDLPVDMKVEYTLDGKRVSPDEIAGKSGHVKIKYSFTSNQSETINKKDMTVPFVTVTGVMMDDDVFSNVSVSNGKVMKASDHSIAAGIALPGFNKAIEGADLPTSFTVEADAKKFKLGNPMTLVSNSLINTDNLKDMDADSTVANISGQVNALIDGSSQLYKGMATLLASSQKLNDGASQLVTGSSALNEGAVQLDQGAASLAAGAAQLNSGLQNLAGNNSALVSGAGSIFSALVATSNDQLQKALADSDVKVPDLTTSNYNEVLQGVIDEMGADKVYNEATEKAKAQITEQVEAKSEDISQGVTAEVKKQVEAQVSQTVNQEVTKQVTDQVLASQGLTQETYQQGIADGTITAEQQQQITDAITQNTNAQMQSPEVTAKIADTVTAQMGSEAVKQTIAENIVKQKDYLIQMNLTSDEVQGQIAAAVDKVNAAAGQVSSLKGNLNNVQTFYNALVAYTNGVASAANGASSLADGSATLKSGADALVSGSEQLYTGMTTLNNGTVQLVEGVGKLEDGSMQLEEGILKGLSKVENLEEKMKDVEKVITKYNKGKNDKIKFIYKTDEIK